MLESLFTKLLGSLADPVNLILLLWIYVLMRVNNKLLDAQQERGVVLAKIAMMLQMMLGDRRGGDE